MRTPIEKNLSPVARTLSESLRDAEYACAIQTFKSDVKLTIDFFLNAIIGFSIVGIAIALPIALFVWLTK